MNAKNVRVGQEFYIRNRRYGQVVQRGTVTEIKNVENVDWVRLKGVAPDTYGSFGARVKDLYHTREEALAAYQKENKEQVQAYVEEIKDMHDLVNFAHNHTIALGAGEYTNHEAREAYFVAAKVLGFNIES